MRPAQPWGPPCGLVMRPGDVAPYIDGDCQAKFSAAVNGVYHATAVLDLPLFMPTGEYGVCNEQHLIAFGRHLPAAVWLICDGWAGRAGVRMIAMKDKAGNKHRQMFSKSTWNRNHYTSVRPTRMDSGHA